jgi:SagB-type dehydrogenase family enzyme
MKAKYFHAIVLIFFIIMSKGLSGICLGETQPIKLPPPQTSNGKPLMQALAERRSVREFSAEDLSPQTISDLLWAANGVNRPDGRRTAPSAHNAQEIDIYVAQKEGLYFYNATANELLPVLDRDIRALAGKQAFVKAAPVSLVFVADLAKLRGGSEEDALFYSATDTGYISQNVYLYCASAGLATVVLGWVDKEDLTKAMGLRPDQRVILTQPVGYPKNQK